MEQLVLVPPVIDEHNVCSSAVVRTNESNVVIARRDGWRMKLYGIAWRRELPRPKLLEAIVKSSMNRKERAS